MVEIKTSSLPHLSVSLLLATILGNNHCLAKINHLSPHQIHKKIIWASLSSPCQGHPLARSAFHIFPLSSSIITSSLEKFSFLNDSVASKQFKTIAPSPKTNHHHHHPFVSPSSHHLTKLRGGAILLPSPPSLATAVLISSKIITIYAFVAGTSLLLSRYFYGIVPTVEKDSFESSQLQMIGAIVLGLAIHVYLMLIAPESMEAPRAMGCALLPRIFIILYSFLRKGKENKNYHFHGSGFLKVNFVMMSWTAFVLLTNVGNPTLLTKLFSAMATVKALALIVNPVKMTKKIFDVDVSGDDMAIARFLSRALGNYLAISAILMLFLAFGASSMLAVGISFGVWFFLLFDMAFLTKAWGWMPTGRQRGFTTTKQMVHLIVSLFSAIMLLAGSRGL